VAEGHPIVDQVHFTEAADESLATDYADRLRKAGFTLKAPVITRALVTHDRRIEVWVNERLE
jgi:hypothetical protein